MIRSRYKALVIAIGVVMGIGLTGSVAFADTLGQTVSLNVDSSYDAAGSSVISTTIRAISQNAYVAVDDRAWAKLSISQQQQANANLNQLASDFDTNIYPKATAFWGNEAKPGLDGDPRITVLVENLIAGVGGYFQSANAYSKIQAPDSNVREMVAISFDSVFNGNSESFLAHEFQHLISFNQKELTQNMSDDTWLNEARSEYGITLTGYNQPYAGSTLQRRVQTFLRTPSDSLTDWPNTSIDYSIATLFTHYLADRFGPDILQASIRSRANGTAAIDEWLIAHNQPERFGDVFADWMVASSINDQSFGLQYAYATAGLQSIHVSPQFAMVLGAGSSSVNATLKEWQPLWLQFVIPNSQLPAVNVQLSGQAGSSWWGGDVVATYADGHHRVIPFVASGGQAVASALTTDGASSLVNVGVDAAQGSTVPADGRQLANLAVTVTVSLGQVPAATPVPVVSATPTPTASSLHDGDLIRRPGQQEVYVIWGTYRRYLPQGVLQLYGFQNRPVVEVVDDVFNRYTTSNYVRAVDGTKVYALWPDTTKHWLNITPAQWDASGRDWNAIFIINDAEVNFYTSGPDITR